MGKRIGKAKMAVKVELLLVFAAMPETKVNTPENPKLASTKTAKKGRLFSKGFPKSRLKKSQLISPIKTNNKPLKSSLDRMMDWGLHNW